MNRSSSFVYNRDSDCKRIFFPWFTGHKKSNLALSLSLPRIGRVDGTEAVLVTDGICWVGNAQLLNGREVNDVVARLPGNGQAAFPLAEGPEQLGDHGLHLQAVQGDLLVVAHRQHRVHQEVALAVSLVDGRAET